jgi:hypothetical protein
VKKIFVYTLFLTIYLKKYCVLFGYKTCDEIKIAKEKEKK